MAELHAILVQQVFFAATGVSDGDLLRGVRYFSGGASTNSIVMRASSGTGQHLRHVLHASCCHIVPLSTCFGWSAYGTLTTIKTVLNLPPSTPPFNCCHRHYPPPPPAS